jgi:hypothetical protein
MINKNVFICAEIHQSFNFNVLCDKVFHILICSLLRMLTICFEPRLTIAMSSHFNWILIEMTENIYLLMLIGMCETFTPFTGQ